MLKFFITAMKLFMGFLFLTIGTSMIKKEASNGLRTVDKMLYAFIEREGKNIGVKYKMRHSSVGGGTDKENKINQMCFGFQRYGTPLTELEARELIISSLNNYLAAVNSDEKLKPFLSVYPFTAKNIDMRIHCYYSTTELEVYYPHMTTISAYEGKISYFSYDELNDLKPKYKKSESYEEAVAILEKSNAIEK